jgi:hypothetical protein
MELRRHVTAPSPTGEWPLQCHRIGVQISAHLAAATEGIAGQYTGCYQPAQRAPTG